RGIDDLQVEYGLGRLLATPPLPGAALVADGVAIRPPRGARGGGHGRHLEPGMVREGNQGFLTGDAGRTDDRDAPLAHGRGVSRRAPASQLTVTPSDSAGLPGTDQPAPGRLEHLGRGEA